MPLALLPLAALLYHRLPSARLPRADTVALAAANGHIARLRTARQCRARGVHPRRAHRRRVPPGCPAAAARTVPVHNLRAGAMPAATTPPDRHRSVFADEGGEAFGECRGVVALHQVGRPLTCLGYPTVVRGAPVTARWDAGASNAAGDNSHAPPRDPSIRPSQRSAREQARGWRCLERDRRTTHAPPGGWLRGTSAAARHD